MTLTRRTLPARLIAREDTGDGKTITGIAVPFDAPTQIVPGYREQIARGAIDCTNMPMLFYRHDEPIGVVTSLTETAEGLEMTARISDTSLGRDVATLARDGAIASLSIGFYESEYEDTKTDEGTLRTQTRIDLREISLVPIPAYEPARITNVRSKEEQENPPMDTLELNDAQDREDFDTLTRGLEDLTASMTNLERRMALTETTSTDAPKTVENRSAGELIKAYANGDDSARSALAPYVGRSFTGTTTDADARYNEPTFISDLTRLVVLANPLMELFSKGSLPAEGNTIEFAELKDNTIKAGKQAKEGDPLPTGSVSVQTKTATVNTYGGGAVLSRQVIERSRSNILDLHLRALTLTMAKELANAFATEFTNVVKAQASQAITTAKPMGALDWKTILHMMLDAQEAYEDQALVNDGLILTRPAFEAVAGMTDTSGRPILQVAGNTGDNTIGTVHATGKFAQLDGLKIITNKHIQTGATGLGEGTVGAFYNAQALRSYTSGLVSLQDANVLDLTNAFSVYQYAAFASEIPSALIPLKMAN